MRLSISFFVVLFSLIFSSTKNCSAQNWAWAKGFGNINSETGLVGCALGGTPGTGFIVAGTYSSSSITFTTLNVGVRTFTNSGGLDIFVLKFDANGGLLSAEALGGSGDDIPTGITNWNITVCGYFNSPTLTTQPSSTFTAVNKNPGTDDIFLMGYGTSASMPSTFLYSFGGTFDDRASGIYGEGTSLHMTGQFYSPSFTVGTVSNYTITNSNLTGTTSDIFVIGFGPVDASNAICLWKANTGGPNSDDIANGITVGGTNVGITGSYVSPTNTTVIGTSTLTSYGGRDVFIADCNSSGIWQWSRGIGGTSLAGDFASGIECDASNNFYITGTYNNSAMVIGTSTLTNSGNSDGFIAKYNSAGTFGWANNISGTNMEYCNRIDVTKASGEVVVSGGFSGTSLTIGTSTLINTNSGSTTDIFVAKYNSAGTPLWATSAKGNDYEISNGVSSDANGNIYITGSFTTSPTSFGTTTLTSAGSSDAFVAKLACGTITITPSATLVCQLSTVTLTATGATTYTWNGSAGTSTFSQGMVAPTVFTVSFTNGTCISSQTIFIDVLLPQAALAGGNQTVCISSPNATMSANTPSTGVGTWALVSGGGTITNSLSPTTSITGLPLGTNVFSWTLTRPPCAVSVSNVTITVKQVPTTASASSNQTLCITSPSATVSGNIPTVGVGSWIKISGPGTITNSLSATTTVTGLGVGANIFRWSISNPPCTASVSDVTITVNQVPTGAMTGSNQLICISTGSVFLIGNFPGTGTGSWSLVSGSGIITNSLSSTSPVTGLGIGANVFAWTISNSPCIASTSTVSINVNDVPSVSNAGPSQTVCPSSSSITTAANTPTIGSGSWSLVSGSGIITNSFSPTTTITGLGAGTNVFAWTISNPPCAASVSNLTITVVPASLNAGSNFNLVCKQQQLINATTNPPSPTSVVWTPTTGLSSSTILTPTAKGTGSNIIYTVTCVLSNGCIPPPSTVSVGTTTITAPSICMVTVDSLGFNNEIFWDKTLYPNADSFFVYREVSASVYTKIGSIPRTSLSMYVDTNRSIGPANGNPNLTAYKYKLQYRDSCGAYSPLSLWHQTIFIQDQLNGNFNWNQYTIEPNIFPVTLYSLKRRDVATGTETVVLNTTSIAGTDPAYASFWPLNVRWFVDYLGFSCSVTSKIIPGNETMVLKAKTKSNQSNDKLFATGVSLLNLSENIRIYPNPANDVLNIELNNISKLETQVEIQNTLGQVVYQNKTLNQHLAINTSDLAGGVYIVNIKQNGKAIAVKKVVIER